MLDLVWLIPLLALAGAAVNLFLGRRLGKAAGWLATALVGLGVRARGGDARSTCSGSPPTSART